MDQELKESRREPMNYLHVMGGGNNVVINLKKELEKDEIDQDEYIVYLIRHAQNLSAYIAELRKEIKLIKS